MKKRGRFRIQLSLLLVLLLPAVAHAQIEANLGKYTGPNAEGYLDPLKEAFGASLQAGMFRSAYIPRSGLQINLDVKTMFVKFSDEDRTFTAQTEEGFFPSQQAEAPTVIGDTSAVVVPGQGGTAAVFPGGFDVGSFGLAVPQLTIGSVWGTQAIVRYIAAKVGDVEVGDVSLIALGARHSISQYLKTPPVDLAVSGLWQNFKAGDDLIDATALTFGLQASRRFSVVEPFLGLSLDSFKMKVDYEYGDETPPRKLSVDFDQTTDFRFGGGVGLNLSFVHLYGEIGVSTQTTYALGLSLGN